MKLKFNIQNTLNYLNKSEYVPIKIGDLVVFQAGTKLYFVLIKSFKSSYIHGQYYIYDLKRNKVSEKLSTNMGFINDNRFRILSSYRL